MTSVPPFLTWSAEAGVPNVSAPADPLVEAEPPDPAPLPFCAGVTAEQPAARKPTAATAPTVRPRRVVLGREPRIARNVMELSHRGVLDGASVPCIQDPMEGRDRMVTDEGARLSRRRP